MKTPSQGGMLVGYARVSTADQNLDLQSDALAEAGASGSLPTRPAGPGRRAGLARRSPPRTGDTLVVWKLDRLGRSLQHLVETVGT